MVLLSAGRFYGNLHFQTVSDCMACMLIPFILVGVDQIAMRPIALPLLCATKSTQPTMYVGFSRRTGPRWHRTTMRPMRWREKETIQSHLVVVEIGTSDSHLVEVLSCLFVGLL